MSEKQKGRKIFEVSSDFFCALVTMQHNKNQFISYPEWPEMPKDARILGVYYAAHNDSLQFVVESETFKIVTGGCEFEKVRICDYSANIRAFPNPFLQPPIL